MNDESVCYRCKHCIVISPGEPQAWNSPAIPADLECDIGNDENFESRYGCWDWTETEKAEDGEL